jgi:hypothetical protein
MELGNTALTKDKENRQDSDNSGELYGREQFLPDRKRPETARFGLITLDVVLSAIYNASHTQGNGGRILSLLIGRTWIRIACSGRIPGLARPSGNQSRD